MTEVVVASGAPEGPRRHSLQRRLVWLTVFRLVLVTILLGGTAVVTWRSDLEAGEALAPLYWVILATYAGSLVVALLLQGSRALGPAAGAHVLFDVTLAAGLTALTGRSESVFIFMFLLAIVNGAILLGRWGAVGSLAVSLAAYGAVVFASVADHPVPAATLFVHAAAFVATAALAGYLAEQLRTAGQRLEARELDLVNATLLHEAIVQSVTSGLLTMAPSGRITFLNQAGEQITGLDAARVLGRPAAQVLPDFAAGHRRGELEWSNARGEARRIGFSRFGLVGHGGRDLGSAVIFQDLTELRALEQEMKRNDRLADLGRVAAGLAHELRNPLASMSGCVEILAGSDRHSPEEERLLAIVVKEAARLEQLVGRFLEYSRPATPRARATALDQLAAEVIDIFSHDPAASRVSIERALRPVTVACDADQVRQVLWNLLLNAAQALQPSGGSRIRVSTAVEPDGGALLVVEDDGPGIDAAHQGRLFTPFFTTKAGGTGLGLATIHRIVEAHGGKVSAGAAAPRGARFTVSLPASGPPPPQALEEARTWP